MSHRGGSKSGAPTPGIPPVTPASACPPIGVVGPLTPIEIMSHCVALPWVMETGSRTPTGTQFPCQTGAGAPPPQAVMVAQVTFNPATPPFAAAPAAQGAGSRRGDVVAVADGRISSRRGPIRKGA